MTKKSLVAMGMAGIMVVGMSMPVLAANGTVTESDSGEAAKTITTVEKTVQPTYTVTIPTSVEPGKKMATIGATGSIEFNKAIKVDIAGLTNSKLTLDLYDVTGTDKANGGTVEVDVTQNNVALTGTTVASYTQAVGATDFTNGTAGDINVSEPVGLRAGKYKSTITFTVSYGTP